MSCGASAIRYLLWVLGIGGSVLLLFSKCHACQKARSPVGLLFFLPIVGALVAALQVEFFFDHQPFQLLRRILQWPTHVFACLRALGFEPRTLRRKCSMHTSHPPGAMIWQYGRIPWVYGCIPTVYGRILPVYGHCEYTAVYLPTHSGCTAVYSGAYGRILRGMRP